MTITCELCGQESHRVEFLFQNERTGKSICSGCVDTFAAELAKQRTAKASLEAANQARLIERAAEKGAK